MLPNLVIVPVQLTEVMLLAKAKDAWIWPTGELVKLLLQVVVPSDTGAGEDLDIMSGQVTGKEDCRGPCT